MIIITIIPWCLFTDNGGDVGSKIVDGGGGAGVWLMLWLLLLLYCCCYCGCTHVFRLIDCKLLLEFA